jgi:23S rRNA (guanine1835-N2)-methyltransferase
MSKTLQFNRVPSQHHHSLKAWNAADELIIQTVVSEKGPFLICNDAFGYLTCHLASHGIMVVVDLKSQEEAIVTNARENNVPLSHTLFYKLTDSLPAQTLNAVMKIPKSNQLFETYLQFIHQNMTDNGKVFCGFMTKYFNKGMISTAEKYFSTITQTKAEKKARVMILADKKAIDTIETLETFDYEGQTIEQYKGVFSSGKIDEATAYLLNNISVPYGAESALDLACGNGIIGKSILKNTGVKSVDFIDDSYLAVASAKRNIKSVNATFHHHYNLSTLDNNAIDWIVSNPPFHFEHTIDISIPISLFEQAYEKLKIGGTLTLVVNSNLGYESHLKKIYKSLKIIASNQRYKIYECRK